MLTKPPGRGEKRFWNPATVCAHRAGLCPHLTQLMGAGQEFLDTNIPLFAGEHSQRVKQEERWQPRQRRLSLPDLQEFYANATRNLSKSLAPDDARRVGDDYAQWIVHAPAAHDVLAAIDLHRTHRSSFRDAMVLRRAFALGCAVLWEVFDWASALEQHEKYSRRKLYRPEQPPGWTPDKGCTLLIDEIDKADSDVPNSLLETLGNRSFSVPWVEQVIGQNPDIPTPLVIITTNEERELPAAFVRRCLVLNLSPFTASEEWYERGRIHFPDRNACSDNVLEQSAQQLMKDREQARQQGVTPPGQAEYIDLLKAVTTLAQDERKQLELLEKLSRFALKKYPR